MVLSGANDVHCRPSEYVPARIREARLCSDGDPSSLCDDVLRDDSVGELCVQLVTLHGNLLGSLPYTRPGLKEGLASQHVARLREYADRWERNVELAAWA